MKKAKGLGPNHILKKWEVEMNPGFIYFSKSLASIGFQDYPLNSGPFG